MLNVRCMAAAVAVLVGVLGAAPSRAQLVSEGVVYAYMAMRIGSVQQPVLVPMPADAVRPDLPPQASIAAAFGLLRNGKPATYGNSSVTATDAMLARNEVTVHIDPGADASAFEVISAETVMTFAALGVQRVVFPGRADQGLAASDIRYATYRLQVPMWQALIGQRLAHADVVLPTGERVDAAVFAQRLAGGDAALTRSALELVQSPDPTIRFYLLGVADRLGIAGFEAAVIPSLTHAEPSIREAAIRPLLASTSTAAWDAILNVMGQDPEPRIRQLAAQALAASPVASYHVFEVFHRAASADKPGRLAAIGEAAALADPRASAQLVPLLGDADADVRRAAADALQTRRAWPELRSAVANEALPPDARVAAATALADAATGDDQRIGLEYRGMNTTGGQATAAIDRVAALAGTDPRPSLEAFLGHVDPAVAAHAAAALAARRDVAALPALARVGADETRAVDVRIAAGDAAFAILGGLRLSELDTYLTGRDRFLKRAAYRALGELVRGGASGSSVQASLTAGLSDADPGVRGASARAMAAFATPEALTQILALETDADADVQADVALALQGFGAPQFADTVGPAVVGFVQSGEPAVIAAGLATLAALQQRNLVSIVLDKVQYPDARVRAAALRAAADLADPGELQPVINAMNAALRDPELPNRVLGAQLLGRFNDPLAVLSLSQVVNGPVPELRFAAIGALGQTRHDDAVGTLLALLEDPDREIRLAAVQALTALNRVSALPGIQAQVARETDPASVDALQRLVTHLQTHGS